VTLAPATVHQVAVSEIWSALSPYVEREQLGIVLMSPADLELLPDTSRNQTYSLRLSGAPPADFVDFEINWWADVIAGAPAGVEHGAVGTAPYQLQRRKARNEEVWSRALAALSRARE
jgi:hypothetical protein